MKILPRWWIGVIPFVIYNLIIYSTWAAVGADYTKMVGSDVAFKCLVLPLGLGAAFMIVTLSYLGWWRPVMSEDKPGMPVWALWPIVAIMGAMIVLNLSNTNWSSLAASHIMTLVAAGILVGFNEEALTRGILVIAWRGATKNEAWVWFWATFLFGLMHLPNALFGTGLIGGVLQTGLAFMAGCGFYVVRRLGGTLVVPMALHGLWDFSSFAHQASGADVPDPRLTIQFATYLVSLAMVIVVLWAGRKKRTEDAGQVIT